MDSERADRSEEPPRRDNRRPRTRRNASSGGEGQALLLKAARAEFAARGLAGARVDNVAQRSGVNKQLVYHYFGSKDRLYLAVLEDAYRRFTARFTKTDIQSGTAAERLTKYVELLFDSLQSDSEFLALVTDQNLHGGRHIKQSKAVRNILSPLIADLEKIIIQARDERALKLDVEAIDLYLTIAGICAFYFTNMNTLSAGLGQQFDSKSAIAKRRKSIVEFILSALFDAGR